MLDYQAIIKSDTATRLLNVFTFEYISDSNEKIKYENIDVILDKLTRAGSDIVSIDKDGEYAVISYKMVIKDDLILMGTAVFVLYMT